MSRGAARLNDVCTGHGCWPPRPNDQGSPNVFINSRPAHRQYDHWVVHCCDESCHDSALASGSPTVFTNSRQQGRIGDPVMCGSSVMTGSSNVFVGNSSTMRVPPISTIYEKMVMENDDPTYEGNSVYSVEESVEKGIISENDVTEQSDEIAEKPENEEVPVSCGDLKSPIDGNTRLSEHFTVADLTTRTTVSRYELKAQAGLSKEEIACNLKHLCENILEPMLADGIRFTINSGFRHGNGNSQHYKGMAVDLSFSNCKKKRGYYEKAVEIANKYPFDQIILESSGGPQSAWVHISFNKAGNRRSLLTTNDARTYISGLHPLKEGTYV